MGRWEKDAGRLRCGIIAAQLSGLEFVQKRFASIEACEVLEKMSERRGINMRLPTFPEICWGRVSERR